MVSTTGTPDQSFKFVVAYSILIFTALSLFFSELFLGPSLWLAIGYSLLSIGLVPFLRSSPVILTAVICGFIFLHSSTLNTDYALQLGVLNGVLLLLIVSWRYYEQEVQGKKFESSRAQLDALWATIVDGLIVIDDRATIVSVNPATERLFGYLEEELIGQNVKVLMPHSYSVEHDKYVAAYNETGEARIIGKGRDVEGLRKDGTQFPMYLAVNQFEIKGRVYYGGIVRDTSAETEIRSALVEAKNAAENASKAKTKFLNSISHEVRTPLNAILGFAQLFEVSTKGKIEEPGASYLKHIQESGEHLLSIINEVLDLSQIEAGKMNLSIEAVAVHGVLDECITMVSPLAEKYGIIVNSICDLPEESAVLADRVRLKQAFVNLCTNAIKYNRANGTVTCEIVKLDDNKIRFTVSDTGVGIPKEKQEGLFEPFNRLGREASSIEGTGIGLAVTKTVVESMNAEMDFTSDAGMGSRFWLDFPAAINRAASNPLHTKTPIAAKALSATSQKDKTTILYIEDNPANTILMEQFLGANSGVHLVTAHTAEEGLRIVKNNEVDVILMDLNLPGMDGFEAYRLLSKDQQTSTIPVIAVSADVNSKTIQRAMNLGFERFISKPFNLNEARKTIKSVLPIGSDRLH